MEEKDKQLDKYWSMDPGDALAALESSNDGLSSAEAARRLQQYGPNVLEKTRRRGTFSLFIGQFKSPIILILIGAAIIALFVTDVADAAIILVIVFLSGVLGFWQEKGAADAVEKLLAIVQVKAMVVRDGKRGEVALSDVAPGDVVALDAGDMIPGDGLVLYSNHLFVDQASLTGETFPVEKDPASVDEGTPMAQRKNVVFMGTHVVSGDALVVVVKTGMSTEFGSISEHLKSRREETEFERGIRHFGYLLMEVTLILVIAIFAINVAFHKPEKTITLFLFSLTLAVGLTPQLLPAIISVNLSKGARRMASHKVIVKRLVSIENFGGMNVFCSDKTGTLTEGVVQVSDALGVDGNQSDKVKLYAYLNSAFETGFTNPIDEAIRGQKLDISGYAKLDEVPYDFNRKRLSILVKQKADGGKSILITKGALNSVLAVCNAAEKPDGTTVPIPELHDDIQARYEKLGSQGFRTLGVAYRGMDEASDADAIDEKDMCFLGILALFDPPKKGVDETIERLSGLGVRLKVITGDNKLVAGHVGQMVGLEEPVIMTGDEVVKLNRDALAHRVNGVDIFAEVEPNEKEAIVRALVAAGNVVGYMGDGINDAPALHAADVGVSVDTAVDVAKEAADFVLLERDLDVLANGVIEGRRTFANTMKYVFMATSANFGNMFSMAGASLFLHFLPLLPDQVLMINLLTDLPELTIATDSVDTEMVDHPRRWDISFIRRFMLVFGLLSSVFDYLTFLALILLLNSTGLTWHSNAYQMMWRTGWFVESVISASMIVLVIRTKRVFFKSKPSNYLMGMTALVAVVVIALPYTGFGHLLGLQPFPAYFYPILLGIMVLYIASAELAKNLFYRWNKF